MLHLLTVAFVACAIETSAFTFPRISAYATSSLSSSALRTSTVDVPKVDQITIDKIFTESETESIDSLNQTIQVAALGGNVKSGVLVSKTVSIYRDTSCDVASAESAIGKKSPLLFLPGLDGVGNYSSNSVGKLNVVFDVWKMAIKGEDRSTFIELASVVLKALDTFEEPVVLVGESFGGLLAAYIALRAKEGKISKLILINPATSFDRTNWNVLAPIIASSGRAFPLVGMSALLATAVDVAQIQRVGFKIASSINSTEQAVSTFSSLFEAGKFLLDLIPAETLQWRISKWFGAGTSIMEGKYSQIKIPTLIMVGKNDRLLPSRSEGRRLFKEMTGSKKVEVKEFDIGHALLEDNFIDFADVILKSEAFAVPKEDPLDATFPTEDDMLTVEKEYGGFIKAISPVFLTRGKDGQLKRGLEAVPTGLSGRPVLLVGNHQLYGADLAPIVREFINTKGTLVRGLAHPMIFADRGVSTAQQKTFVKFGAVEVSPTNIFQLLKRNETVMLFPGGAAEALHGKGDEYKLFWPERTDFVRMAGLLDAIIVPFSAVGIADSVNILFDAQDIKQVPFLSSRLEAATASMQSARAGVPESIVPPFFLPKAPERNYFLFGQPFDTRDLNIYNKKECKSIYNDVRSSVEDGLQTLLRFRESDPYREYIPRTIYEFASGGKQAPTAPLNLK